MAQTLLEQATPQKVGQLLIERWSAVSRKATPNPNEKEGFVYVPMTQAQKAEFDYIASEASEHLRQSKQRQRQSN